MPSESSSTVTILKEHITETIINPSNNEHNFISQPIQPKINEYTPVNIITNNETVNEESDMSKITEEVINKIINKVTEKINDSFIFMLDSLKIDIESLNNNIKSLQIDASHQIKHNIEVNERLMQLEHKIESKLENITKIDIDSCVLNKIKQLLINFINKK